MKIVFFGSSEFSIPCLKALLNTQHQLICVVTQPDKQKGRGLNLGSTIVKEVAQEKNLNLYQPFQINNQESINFLKNLNPDLFVVIAYGQILSKKILEIPKIFSLNVHASVLPKYRGACPINWAIIQGEEDTGISIIKMTEKMDAGPIILQKKIKIRDDQISIELEKELSSISAELLIQVLDLIEKNNYKLIPQDESKVSFAPKLKKEDGRIDWQQPAKKIYNLIRGLQPWPGTFTFYKGKMLKIYKASVSPSTNQFVNPSAGEIIEVSKRGIIVACGKDNLIIEELQIEGKKRISAEAFIAGYKIKPKEKFQP